MTPYETELKHQENIETQDEIANNRFIEGSTDAAMGESPQSDDEDYLNGYLDALRILIRVKGQRLQICWLSDAYISGGYDSAEEF